MGVHRWGQNGHLPRPGISRKPDVSNLIPINWLNCCNDSLFGGMKSTLPWAQFGGGMGDVSSPLFQTGDTQYAMSPHFFLFRFCVGRGFTNKSDVCHVLCEKLFMLDGRPHIAKLMLKQSLLWYHWCCKFINFSCDKIFLAFFKFLEVVKDT